MFGLLTFRFDVDRQTERRLASPAARPQQEVDDGCEAEPRARPFASLVQYEFVFPVDRKKLFDFIFVRVVIRQ